MSEISFSGRRFRPSHAWKVDSFDSRTSARRARHSAWRATFGRL